MSVPSPKKPTISIKASDENLPVLSPKKPTISIKASDESLPVIIGWKDRRNCHKDAVQSRFVVRFEDKYYQVEGVRAETPSYRLPEVPEGVVMCDLFIEELPMITSEVEAMDHIKTQVKGRDSGLLADKLRSTEDNLLMGRIVIEIKKAIMALRTKQQQGSSVTAYLYNTRSKLFAPEWSIEDGISHDEDGFEVERYSVDGQSVDTGSSFNGSCCSSDSRAEIYNRAGDELMYFLIDHDVIPALEDYTLLERAPIYHKLLRKFQDMIYADVVAYGKALEKLRVADDAKRLEDEVSEERVNHWKGTIFCEHLSALINVIKGIEDLTKES